MRILAGTIYMFAALVISCVCFAQNPAAFDGAYGGVSSTILTQQTANTTRNRACSDFPIQPLTIAAGTAQTVFLLGTAFSGHVGPQGQLQLQDSGGIAQIAATIDATGVARGRVTSRSGCSWDLVWQKGRR